MKNEQIIFYGNLKSNFELEDIIKISISDFIRKITDIVENKIIYEKNKKIL